MTQTMPSLRRLDYHYIIMQAGYWAMFAAICGYQAALLGERGFTDGQIGLLIAVRCLAGIFCQPLLGRFADRHPSIPLGRIVSLCLGISLVACLAFQFVPLGLTGTLIALFLIGGFEVSVYPLMDAMAIQYINVGVPIRYSLGRGIGSFCYAICCIFLGFQAETWGTEATLYTHAGLVILEILLVITYPHFHGEVEHSQEKPKTHSALYLLQHNPSFALMLLALMLGICGVLPLSFFMFDVLQAHGGTSSSLGIGLFLMAASELPTAFFFQRLYRKLGSSKLLVVSMSACLARVLCVFFAPSLLFVLLVQPLQMLGYGLFTPASVYYVNESVPQEDRVQGQTLMMVATNGLGGVLGSLLGGQALELGGVTALLLFCAFSCALATLLAGISTRLRSGKKASHGTSI